LLKNEISRCELVLEFFKLSDEDILMHSNESIWIKSDASSLSSSDEPPKDITDISSPVKAQEYNVEKTYKAKTRSEVSVRKDTKVAVIEKSLSGWWFISTQNGEQGGAYYLVLVVTFLYLFIYIILIEFINYK